MASPGSTAERESRPSRRVVEPVMKVNSFDRLSAGLMAAVLGLMLAALVVIIWWATTRPPRVEFLVPMEMVEIAGGSEDGAPDETLKIESPEDPNDNPSPNEEVLDEQQVTEVVDNVITLADQATQQAQQVNAESSDATGTPGSKEGTGRRGLGSGPGEGGVPNEQRWFIRYSDESSLTEYAKQLDFFGIELGALLPDGQLVYLSDVSKDTPTKRISRSGKDEKRLYMTWQGGTRKDADAKLYQKIGVNVDRAILFHFYPKPTEQTLLTQEYQYAKRQAKEIRRTYFVVVKQGQGYAFIVTRQTYLR